MEEARWHGNRHPSHRNLTELAKKLGAAISHWPFRTTVFIQGMDGVRPVIMAPKTSNTLKAIWKLAHEVGHLCLHSAAGGSFH